MATGWAELRTWIRRRVAADKLDLEATWIRFLKLAAGSEHVDILKHIVHVGRILPDRDRYRLVVAATRLLAPIEWPKEWSEARLALVVALVTLVEETDPYADASFFALHDTSPPARRMTSSSWETGSAMASEPRSPGIAPGLENIVKAQFKVPPDPVIGRAAAALRVRTKIEADKIECERLDLSDIPVHRGSLFDMAGTRVPFPDGGPYDSCYVALVDPSEWPA